MPCTRRYGFRTTLSGCYTYIILKILYFVKSFRHTSPLSAVFLESFGGDTVELFELGGEIVTVGEAAGVGDLGYSAFGGVDEKLFRLFHSQEGQI